MALLDTHRPHGSALTVASRIAKAASDLVANVADWNDARRTRAALSQLSAHELDDLGLSYGDIEKIGRGFKY